ncbi:NAD(P)/FAD-dependent oxidoreductase [Sediminicoccus sp. KRV36]|uniref:NAD(P)/FAD-dependent oxidoreductase n=1 Tax=Sediminicoccus sp. KRV36 TaxID=3133721 RepID=UPI00200D6F1D|nr:NAD(P)/FAD-dependent oxidoreductase [Sediminicoccus rosea]UPY36404.1 FAD-dependent oxidoreductase [Sediminicoccus rosea]
MDAGRVTCCAAAMALDPTSLAGKTFPLRAAFDHAVIGAGEAGIAAALAAAARGERVILLDEQPLDPGLIGLDIPFLFGGRVGPAVQQPARMEERVVAARPGLEAAMEAGVEVALGVSVWGGFQGAPFILGLADRATAWLVGAARLTIAAGARDVVVPFEGWELPGVMGARGLDAAHRLLGDFTGNRVAVIGAGAVSFPEIALRLSEACEIRILGSLEVEGIAWKDGSWRELACDTVVLAVDAAPNIELADVLGGSIAWDTARGGFVAASLPGGVAITGDAAGTAPVARAAWMQHALSDPARMICACEEVRLADLRALRPPRYLGAEGPRAGLAAIEGGPQDQVKRLTRAGMGPCQGRRCRDSVQALLAQDAALPAAPRMASYRAPLRPLPLAVLGALEEDPALRANWTGWFGIAEQWLPHWEPVPEEAVFIGGRLSEVGK